MVPPSENDSSAMLLYEAPTGLAIFCFDGGCLDDLMEDFGGNLAQPSLEFFLKYEKVSTPIDLANEAIDDHLTKNLTKLCGSEKKLVVGNTEYKRIIEVKLGITCLYVDVPDCEVIIRLMKNPMRTSLPEEKSETNMRDCLPISKELITFLRQHYCDANPETVSESIAELAQLLHDVELCEMEHLKFFCILLKDFIVKSGIDTKNWKIFQFATVPKMICSPGSSYEVYHPDKLFSRAEFRKIEANASRYKKSFSKIGASSVYKDVVSLYTKWCLLLHDLEEVHENAEVISLPICSEVGNEGSTDVDDRLNSIAEDNCSEVTLVKGNELDFSCERPQQDVKQILAILGEDPSMEKPKVASSI